MARSMKNQKEFSEHSANNFTSTQLYFSMIIVILICLATRTIFKFSSHLHHKDTEHFIDSLSNYGENKPTPSTNSSGSKDISFTTRTTTKTITSKPAIASSTTRSTTTISTPKILGLRNFSAPSTTLTMTQPTTPKIHSLQSTAYVTTTSQQELPNILFFKTHKTGSSAIQNLFFRLAYSSNLTIGWPYEREGTSIHWPHRFKPDYITNNRDSVDIMCNHVAYEPELLEFLNRTSKFSAKEKPLQRKLFVFTILREEFSLLKSTYNYYRNYENNCMKSAKTLTRYITHNWDYVTEKIFWIDR